MVRETFPPSELYHRAAFCKSRVSPQESGSSSNEILDCYDAVRGFPEGSLKIVVHHDDDDGSWSRSMFREFAHKARQPHGPRFQCGLLGTVFVDVVLKGSLVRMRIDALSFAKERVWYVEPIRLD